MNSNDLLDPVSSGNGPHGYYSKPLPNATATLVLGICSIVGCLFYGVPGLICEIIALVLHQKDKRMHATDPAGYAASFKNAKAGYICAVIGTSLSALYFITVLIIFIAAFSGMSRF